MKNMIVRAYVTLLDVHPAIWRRIEFPAEFTLKGLHDTIQRSMGWLDYHLHHFQIGSRLYGEPTPEDRNILNERKLKLGELRQEGQRAFEYMYDYGDEWRCAVVLEALAPAQPGMRYPRIIGGARRGPPEDVGGPLSYAEFVEGIADRRHERHKEFMEWIGGSFDPDDFDIKEINRALLRLSPRARVSSKKSKATTLQ